LLTPHRIFLIFFLSLSLMAENVSWNIATISNLGRGEQVGLGYDYLETYINGTLQSGPWNLELRLEYSDPPEYGYTFTGLDRAVLRYTGNAWTLEAGDIAAVFGRGLALNLYEDQSIDFDNEIKGLRLTSSLLQDHEIDIFAGLRKQYRFYSPRSNLREPDGEADYELAGLEMTFNGASGSWSGSPYFIGSRFRSEYLWRELDPMLGIVTADTLTQTMHIIQSGWRQSLYGQFWDLYFEYNRTWKTFDYPLITQNIIQTEDGLTLQNGTLEYASPGQALNLQVNWFPEWFTAMFEYKRYLNGPELTENKRNPFLLAGKPLPWQLGPTGIRQHDINLLANVTHPVDYGDELGWGLELGRSLNDRWFVNLNAAQTSQARDSRDLDQAAGYIPRQEITRNPWQEYFMEVEYIGDHLSQRMFIAYTRSVLSGEIAAEIARHFTVVPVYLSWHSSDELVFSTVIELQNSSVSGELYRGEVVNGHNYQSTHGVGSIDLKHNYSVSVIWDTSNDPLLNDGLNETRHWISGEVSLKPLDGLWVRASYGTEKGGIRCTGGVCRVLNPFEGFRMALEWRL